MKFGRISFPILDYNGDGFFLWPSIYIHRAVVNKSTRTAYIDFGIVLGKRAIVVSYYPRHN